MSEGHLSGDSSLLFFHCSLSLWSPHREHFIPAIRRYIPGFKATCKQIFALLLSINLSSQAGWIENQRWADRWVTKPSIWDEEEDLVSA